MILTQQYIYIQCLLLKWIRYSVPIKHNFEDNLKQKHEFTTTVLF